MNAMILVDQPNPTLVISLRAMEEYTVPPREDPDAPNPIASGRFLEKYGATVDMLNRKSIDDMIPENKPCVKMTSAYVFDQLSNISAAN